jgi:hypothetical protein
MYEVVPTFASKSLWQETVSNLQLGFDKSHLLGQPRLPRECVHNDTIHLSYLTRLHDKIPAPGLYNFLSRK